MNRTRAFVAAVGVWACAGTLQASASTAMRSCGGQSYQAAGALTGTPWQDRTDCGATLDVTRAAATPTVLAATVNFLKPPPAAVPAAAASAAAPATSAAPASSTKPGAAIRAISLERQRQCGAEWKANKASLKKQTPGLTWSKFFSQCNSRLREPGQ